MSGWARSSWQVLVRAQRRWPLAQLAALALLFFYGFMTVVGFASAANIRTMLVLGAILGIASAGQTLVFIVGGLDLSIGGFISAAGIAISQLCGVDHWALAPAIIVTVSVLAVFGGVSGWICHRFFIVPIIVTLGMGSIVLGIALVWVHGQVTGTVPAFLGTLTAANGTTFGIGLPPIVFIWAAIAVALAVLLHRTLPGRRLYATGANPRAAELNLIRTRRVWVVVFALSAAFSAVAGILLAGFGGADPSAGDPYFFEGLTAIVVGGTTVMGARGDYTHTVVGALILTVLGSLLAAHDFNAADQQIVFGLLILLVVAGYGREARMRDRI